MNRKSSTSYINSYATNLDTNHPVREPQQSCLDIQSHKFTDFSIDYILHKSGSPCIDRKENVKELATKNDSATTSTTIGYRDNECNNDNEKPYHHGNHNRHRYNFASPSTSNISYADQSNVLVQNQVQSLQPVRSMNLSSHPNQSVPVEPNQTDEGKMNHLRNDTSTRSKVNHDKSRAAYPSISLEHLPTSFHERYLCEICHKSFANPHCLSRHMRIHTGEKPYRCNICKKAFNQSFHLTIHKRLHTGDLRYQCNICYRRFVQSNDLKKHYRTHTGEKPYRCKSCFKCFADASQLKKHVRIHTGEKPYVCKICQRGFTQSGALKKHSHIHK